MKLSLAESKRQQIISLIKRMRASDTEVIVSNYSYCCFFSGNLLTKTLIVLPDEIETKGIIAIDKPLAQVEIPDIINLYKRIIN